MKKVIVFVVIAFIATVGYLLISPFFFDKVVSENLPENVTSTSESEGSSEPFLTGVFRGFDRVHYGSGDVSVYKSPEGHVIRFEENFSVANGPDLFVGLGRDGKYVKEVQLEKLKGNKGSQNYLVPKEINLDLYNEVWVWCRAFSVGFAKAELVKVE